MRDNHASIIMAKDKQISDSTILVAECLAIQEAILIAIQKNLK